MERNIFVFGDSITKGHNDIEAGGWVQRLSLYCENNLDDVSVYNLGISGNTTNDILKRFEFEFKKRDKYVQERIIIFSIGVNDSSFRKSLDNNKVAIEIFEKNIEKLIEIAKKYTDKIIFVGLTFIDEKKLTPLPWNADAFYYLKNVKDYNNIIERVSAKNKLFFVDIFDLLKKDDLDDGVHPNSEGHKKIFEKVRYYLIENNII